MTNELTQQGPDWRTIILELEARLDELRPQLIDAETELADALAAISAFEFNLRSRLQAKVRRLNELQAEIDSYRQQIRQRRLDNTYWDDDDNRSQDTADWEFASGEGAAASGRYRYHEPQPSSPPPTSLSADLLAELKALYRVLARRFHPDLAANESDRSYRTDLMMSINAAYATGDLDLLKRLSAEPDSITVAPQTAALQAEALRREIERCEIRLAEIASELRTLSQHESSVLMRRVERAAAAGRDMIAELAADLQQAIAEKLVERNVLQSQLEEMEADEFDADSDLADLVFDLGLEQAGGDDLLSDYDTWRAGRHEKQFGGFVIDDDILDDSD